MENRQSSRQSVDDRFAHFCRRRLCHGFEVWAINVTCSYIYFFAWRYFSAYLSWLAPLLFIVFMLYCIALDWETDHDLWKAVLNIFMLFACFVPMLLFHLYVFGPGTIL
jgi:hypothetical protein